jgi:two-component system nitrate/nitrite response regulator NarL
MAAGEPLMALRVLLADDHVLFRRGLASLLNESGEFEVVGEASSGPEAVQLVAGARPDIVLLDVHMPGGSGVDAVRELARRFPGLPAIMLTISDQDDDLLAAIRAGARGYYLKNAEIDELFGALRRAARGQSVLDGDLTQRVFRHLASGALAAQAEPTPLSLRETEILRLVAQGCTNREIAASLNVSENTVKTHLARIYEKISVSTRSAAAALARQRGWL